MKKLSSEQKAILYAIRDVAEDEGDLDTIRTILAHLPYSAMMAHENERGVAGLTRFGHFEDGFDLILGDQEMLAKLNKRKARLEQELKTVNGILGSPSA
jgi:hypothetical protein